MKFFVSAALLFCTRFVNAQDDPCKAAHSDEQSCDADHTTGGGCVWCKCAALPSSCWTKENAAKLPAGVYICDKSESNQISDAHSTSTVRSQPQFVEKYSKSSHAHAAPSGTTVHLNNGVVMPSISLGTCCGSKPSVGLGPWLQAGGKGIDTAFNYYDQEDIQDVLNRFQPKPERDSLFVTTKVPAGFGNSTDCLPGQAGIDSAFNYVKENLRELGMQQVDLVLVHRPCQASQTNDIKASNQALWDGMLEALKANLTRAIGVSNYKPEDLEALDFRGVVPAVNQFMWDLDQHDDEQIHYCIDHGIFPQSYHTMKGCPFEDKTANDIANAHNVSVSQICLRYILEKGGLLAVGTGSDATKVASYAKENLDIYNFELTSAEIKKLDSLSKN